jgi:HTH-type transcriptional regulator / antitoxin HigA
MARIYGYQPDYSIHPGIFVEELIESLGLHQTEIALRLGVSEKHLSNLINGMVPVTPEMAHSLAMVFDYPEKYWLSLQVSFDIQESRKEFLERYRDHVKEYDEWLSQFDYRNLRLLDQFKERYPSDDPPGRIRNLLTFFSCSDIGSWNRMYQSDLPAACRITGGACAKRGNTVAWIRNGQLTAMQRASSLPSYRKAIFRSSLGLIRRLTATDQPEVFDEMRRICEEAGVLLVFAREIPKSGISGAAFWTNSSRTPCILMNLRFKKNDHFWFTFFHEAFHVLKEHKKIIYLDCDDRESDDMESETDRQASDFLIPAKSYHEFLERKLYTRASISEFSAELGVHPGVVVGRLQHDRKIPWNWCNDLKTTLRWSDSS